MYKDFHSTLIGNLLKFKIEISNFNDKIAKYAHINNKQLNKQLKQFVITNQGNKNRSEEIRLKKVLFMVSEVKFDIIVFDCVEEK